MSPSQPDHRQAAAEAFMESLNQLEHRLLEHNLQEHKAPGSEPNPVGDRSVQSEQASQPHSDRIDLEALESAAADIEQFMQTKHSGVDAPESTPR
jgi:hypothetical protein